MSKILSNETALAADILANKVAGTISKLDDFLLFDDKQEAQNIRNALQTIFQAIRFKNI